jgi:hypothetical protein
VPKGPGTEPKAGGFLRQGAPSVSDLYAFRSLVRGLSAGQAKTEA